METVLGHSSVLHTSISSRYGHEAPAWFAFLITSRVLVMVPPPQVALQSPHNDQSPTLQSTKDQQFSKDMMMKKRREGTWAFFSVAHILFLQTRARGSCMVCFSGHLPSSLLGSTTASHTAFAPRLPIPNLAVNWKCFGEKSKSKYFQ